MRLEAMHPWELRQAVKEQWPVFVSFGAIEYHAEHLPLGTDTWISEGLLAEIEKRVPIVIAPPIPVAPTMHWAGGAADGDMNFSAGPLFAYIKEYFRCLLAYGFSRIYVMLGHQGLDGDPGTLVKRAAWDLIGEETANFPQGWGQHPENVPGSGRVFSYITPVLYDQYCDYSKLDRGGLENHLFVGHAGRGETQLIQAVRPGNVDFSRLDSMPKPWPEWLQDVFQASEEEGRFWINYCADCWAEYLTKK